MHIAVLGTGAVGQTLGAALITTGHTVTLGSRTADNADAAEWAANNQGGHDTFAGAVGAADLIVNATGGMVSMAALATCDPADLAGTPMLDVANPLDFSGGFPPRMGICNDDSLAERIQREYPDMPVTKALNTCAVEVMVDPSAIPGDHVVPLCGDDDRGKALVIKLLNDLGWRTDQVIDLGGLEAARAMEMWLPLWVRLYGKVGHPVFNLALPQAPNPITRE